ncbi:MAG: tetratricopeptide repeat protein, partial [Candidatus Sumerlaeota bacterium]
LSENFPGIVLNDEAKLHLGDVYYHYGDYFNTYKYIAEAMSGRPVGSGSDIHAHWSLAAHWLGKTDLVRPTTPGDRNFERYIKGSLDPDVRMQYAKLLADGQDHRAAMLEYNRVATGGIMNPSAEQVFQARLALTRYALEDLREGGLDPSIPYDDYMEPFRTLEDLYENTFDLERRTELLLEQARHLIAMDEEVRAIRLILSLLETKDLPEEQAAELREAIWDIMPRVMQAFYREGDQLLALRVYKAFGRYLTDHPRRNEILLLVARIMTEAGMREQALEALGQMDRYASLSPDMQAAVTMLRRELRLDPDDPERYKRDAPSVLAYEYDDQTRARILEHLAEIYAEEGERAYAAQLFLRGAGLEGLTPGRRMDFYSRAAREYEKALNYSKAVEVYYQGLYDLEEAGVPPARGRALYEPAVLGIATNFEAMADYRRAATAFETYLEQYPQSAEAPGARYGLARAYRKLGETEKALTMYEQAAQSAPEDSLWKKAAAQSARQLQWEKEHPYLLREETSE